MSDPSVVIVDDHELFRSGVRAELEGLVDVRADVGSVEEAVRTITERSPTSCCSTSTCRAGVGWR